MIISFSQAHSYGHSYQFWHRYAAEMTYWATGDNSGPARDTDSLKCLYELHDGRMAYEAIVTVKSSSHGMWFRLLSNHMGIKVQDTLFIYYITVAVMDSITICRMVRLT